MAAAVVATVMLPAFLFLSGFMCIVCKLCIWVCRHINATDEKRKTKNEFQQFTVSCCESVCDAQFVLVLVAYFRIVVCIELCYSVDVVLCAFWLYFFVELLLVFLDCILRAHTTNENITVKKICFFFARVIYRCNESKKNINDTIFNARPSIICDAFFFRFVSFRLLLLFFSFLLLFACDRFDSFGTIFVGDNIIQCKVQFIGADGYQNYMNCDRTIWMYRITNATWSFNTKHSLNGYIEFDWFRLVAESLRRCHRTRSICKREREKKEICFN